MDGSEPTVNSPRYVKPLIVKQSTLLKCATFYNGKRMGKTLTLPVGLNKATACTVYTDSPAKDVLVNGVRGAVAVLTLNGRHGKITIQSASPLT